MLPFTVYIAIHNRYNFLAVKYFLQKKGFNVITSSTDFSDTISKQPVHLLIFDSDGFFTDGTDIFRICQKENKAAGFPLVFISDKFDLSDAEPADDTSPDLYQSFKLNELETILRYNLDIENPVTGI